MTKRKQESVERRLLRKMRAVVKNKRNQIQPIYKNLLTKNERWHTMDEPEGSVGELPSDWYFYYN